METRPLSPSRERAALEKRYARRLLDRQELSRLVSYVGNKKAPFLRLFRYKEAFSGSLVARLMDHFGAGAKDLLLDPFCGMGTACFAAGSIGIPSVGLDRLPVAAFAARSLLALPGLEPGQLTRAYERARKNLDRVRPARVAEDIRIIPMAFPRETLLVLKKWKAAIGDLPDATREPMMLLLLSVLEECSWTSKDGQFLRLVRSKALANPTEALGTKVEMAEEDILRHRERGRDFVPGKIYQADARDMKGVSFERPPTLLITSPPYANRYDYSRSYALELAVGFLEDFTEMRALRHSLLRSHIESRAKKDDAPPHPAVQEILDALGNRPLNNPRIPDMLLGYFVDMAEVLRGWAEVLSPGANVAMVVDNVRFGGETVPVDLILSDMAADLGFEVQEIWVARYKGNSSQQMAQYGRVPVRESVVLWHKPF